MTDDDPVPGDALVGLLGPVWETGGLMATPPSGSGMGLFVGKGATHPDTAIMGR